MKKLIKWLFSLVFVAVALLVLAIVCRDAILKEVVERQIRAETGMDVRIGRLSLGLLSPTLRVENCRLYNTSEFGGSPFIDLAELYLEYAPLDLAAGTVRLRLVRLNLAEVNVVEDAQGRNNLESLKAFQQRRVGTQGQTMRFDFAGIDTLNLTLGKARFTSLKPPGSIREVIVGVTNEVVRNLKSPSDFYGLILKRIQKDSAAIPSREASSQPARQNR